MSHGHAATKNVCDILSLNIPGAVHVYPARQKDDKNGTDWWVTHRSGYALSVDCKIRSTDFLPKGCDDLALESYSVVEHKKPGWTRDDRKRTDYVLWLWSDTRRWCLVPFPMLCAVYSQRWQLWRTKYRTERQYTPEYGGYYSECTFVPRKVVWREIYLQYSGQLR